MIASTVKGEGGIKNIIARTSQILPPLEGGS